MQPLLQYEMVNIDLWNENFKIQKVKYHLVFYYLLDLSCQAGVNVLNSESTIKDRLIFNGTH